jgi:hypothetical protein
MNTIRKGLITLSVVLTLSSTAFADEDNFNAWANGQASSNGVSNANCNSALIQSCGSISTAPAPVLGGGMAGLIIAGFAVYIRRRHRHSI